MQDISRTGQHHAVHTVKYPGFFGNPGRHMRNCRATLRLLPLLLLALLSGCGNLYQVTFNDRLVYDPVGSGDLRGDSPFDDPDLGGCVNELLNRNEELGPEDITLLACSSAGISSLYGIHSLPALQQLELSENQITDLNPLSELNDLRVLSIRNNDVSDIRPLFDLRLLRFVSLQGNNNIPCRQLDQLSERLGDGLGRPANCTR